MTRTLSAPLTTAIAADGREPRYQILLNFPSGQVRFVTGDPSRVSFTPGPNVHAHVDVDRVSWRSAIITFNLAELTYVPDLFNAAILGRNARVYKYYEPATGTASNTDRVQLFSGDMHKITGGLKTATLTCGLPRQVAGRRFNATGGFTVTSKPGVRHLNGATIAVRKSRTR